MFGRRLVAGRSDRQSSLVLAQSVDIPQPKSRTRSAAYIHSGVSKPSVDRLQNSPFVTSSFDPALNDTNSNIFGYAIMKLRTLVVYSKNNVYIIKILPLHHCYDDLIRSSFIASAYIQSEDTICQTRDYFRNINFRIS